MRCARAVRKVGYLGRVFTDGQGDCGNYCVPRHRTAAAFYPVQKLRKIAKTDSISHRKTRLLSVFLSECAVFALWTSPVVDSFQGGRRKAFALLGALPALCACCAIRPLLSLACCHSLLAPPPPSLSQDHQTLPHAFICPARSTAPPCLAAVAAGGFSRGASTKDPCIIQGSDRDNVMHRVGDEAQHVWRARCPRDDCRQSHGYQDGPVWPSDRRLFWLLVVKDGRGHVCERSVVENKGWVMPVNDISNNLFQPLLILLYAAYPGGGDLRGGTP